jgi:hypothetical protein
MDMTKDITPASNKILTRVSANYSLILSQIDSPSSLANSLSPYFYYLAGMSAEFKPFSIFTSNSFSNFSSEKLQYGISSSNFYVSCFDINLYKIYNNYWSFSEEKLLKELDVNIENGLNSADIPAR